MLKIRRSQTVKQWLAAVPADRKDAINAVRAVVNKRLPKGYVETVDWGMLAWSVPLERFPDTHNGHPLNLAALGAHTKKMTIYLMTVYGDAKIRKDFQTAYKKTGTSSTCVDAASFQRARRPAVTVVGNTIAKLSSSERNFQD